MEDGGKVRVPFHAWHLSTTLITKPMTQKSQIIVKQLCICHPLTVHIQEDTRLSCALPKATEIQSSQSLWVALTASQAERSGFY